mmetsp:Transcript_30180/g.63115  ORF Transcript_30180/g.63115 Transcript_30180/m.63115 type:complete len:317 (-) Transcript_30180:845-1795(-)
MELLCKKRLISPTLALYIDGFVLCESLRRFVPSSIRWKLFFNIFFFFSSLGRLLVGFFAAIRRLEFENHLIGDQGGSLPDTEFRDDPLPRSPDDVLHLHGFHDTEFLSGLDGITGGEARRITNQRARHGAHHEIARVLEDRREHVPAQLVFALALDQTGRVFGTVHLDTEGPAGGVLPQDLERPVAPVEGDTRQIALEIEDRVVPHGNHALRLGDGGGFVSQFRDVGLVRDRRLVIVVLVVPRSMQRNRKGVVGIVLVFGLLASAAAASKHSVRPHHYRSAFPSTGTQKRGSSEELFPRFRNESDCYRQFFLFRGR